MTNRLNRAKSKGAALLPTGEGRHPSLTRAAGGRALGLAVNAIEEESLNALVEAAVTEFGGLHIMCNHVGGSNPRKDLDLLRMDMDEFDRTMALNVRSTVVGSRAALPHLIAAGGGSIINTASVAGLSHNSLPFIGAPEDIASAMVFLASDESRCITGQLLAVDGGMSSHSAIADSRKGILV